MGISRCRLAGECLRPTRNEEESVSARGLSASRPAQADAGQPDRLEVDGILCLPLDELLHGIVPGSPLP